MSLWRVEMTGEIEGIELELAAGIEAPTRDEAARRVERSLKDSEISGVCVSQVIPAGGEMSVPRRRPAGGDDPRRQGPGRDQRRQKGGGE